MKYIVMQIENGQAVLLDDKGGFITVKDRGYSIGQTITHHSTSLQRICAVAASLVAAVGLSAGAYRLYYTPVSYLSIEINPSIQLSINIFDRVIDYEYFNDDGKLILDNVDIRNGSSKLSVEKIIDAARTSGYLSDSNNSVIIDVAEKNMTLIENLMPLQEEYSFENIELVLEHASKEDAELSKEKNISIAKAKALNEYSQVFGGNAGENSEALKNVSVKEIREKNKKLVNTSPIETADEAERDFGIKVKGPVISSAKQSTKKQKLPLPENKETLPEFDDGDTIIQVTQRPVFENSAGEEKKEEKKDKNKTEVKTEKAAATLSPVASPKPTSAPVISEKHFDTGFTKEKEKNINSGKNKSDTEPVTEKSEDKKKQDKTATDKKNQLNSSPSGTEANGASGSDSSEKSKDTAEKKPAANAQKSETSQSVTDKKDNVAEGNKQARNEEKTAESSGKEGNKPADKMNKEPAHSEKDSNSVPDEKREAKASGDAQKQESGNSKSVSDNKASMHSGSGNASLSEKANKSGDEAGANKGKNESAQKARK